MHVCACNANLVPPCPCAGFKMDSIGAPAYMRYYAGKYAPALPVLVAAVTYAVKKIDFGALP